MSGPDLVLQRPFYPPAALTRADLQKIGDVVEQLIEVLDLAAGDCDLEDDDPVGDYLDTSEGEEEYKTLPIYGIDQTKGPINEREAMVAWHLTQQRA